MFFFYKFLGFTLRLVEVLLCRRKKIYKTYTFKKNCYCDYYHNKEKWKQRN